MLEPAPAPAAGGARGTGVALGGAEVIEFMPFFGALPFFGVEVVVAPLRGGDGFVSFPGMLKSVQKFERMFEYKCKLGVKIQCSKRVR